MAKTSTSAEEAGAVRRQGAAVTGQPGPTHARRAPAALAGVVAAVAAMATAELAAGLLPGDRSPVVAVGDAVIVVTPGPLVTLAIALFGTANRAVLLGAMSLVGLVAGGLVGLGALRSAAVPVAGFAGFAVLAAVAGLTDPQVPTPAALLPPALGALAGGLVLWRLLAALPAAAPAGPVARTSGEAADEPPDPRAPPRSRRAFLGLVGAATGVAALFAVCGRALLERGAVDAARRATTLPAPTESLPPPPAAASLDVDGVSPLLTPNDRFFRIDTALTVPRIRPDDHIVRIGGMVERPFALTYDDLLDLADTEVDVTLACVSNEVGGDLVGNARWLGVPLADLLDRADVRAGATQVVGRAVDGWTAGFPLDVARDGRPAILAIGMNGEPLPDAHGFPVRLVVAGLYGYVSDTKWLTEIELTTFEAYDAYWVRRGWAAEGPIKTQSRIDVPRAGATLDAGPVAVAGVAWAGERGLADVEVAVDDGPWERAELAAELASTTWRQWRHRWDAPSGEHTLRVRATDGAGRTQTAERTPPAPDGATGHHTVRVTVR